MLPWTRWPPPWLGLAGGGRGGEGSFQLGNPNLLVRGLPVVGTTAGILPQTGSRKDLVVAPMGAGWTLLIPIPLQRHRRDQPCPQGRIWPPSPDLLGLAFAGSSRVCCGACEGGAAEKRLRMEELSAPWQRSPASPPQANLADGGDTNYPPSR